MLQANELRKGIKVIAGGKVMEVAFFIPRIGGKSLKGDIWVHFKDDEFFCLISDIQPIPLTPEILEKCGLKRDMESAKYNYNDFVSESLFVRIEKDGFLVSVKNLLCTRHKCLYLHQLMNLYYALTGEELEVKL